MIKTYENEDAENKVTIFIDEYPESPREWSNLGTMLCGHKKYTLGDEQADLSLGYDSWVEHLAEEIIVPSGGHDKIVYLPLYLMDHGGISISVDGFSDVWDSGQVGWIYATKDKFREETSYTDNELFGIDKKRRPIVNEHVKLEGYLTKGDDGWGKVAIITDDFVTVDFDFHKSLDYKSNSNIVTVSLNMIEEVMTQQAKNTFRNEVKIYDDYLQGNVYGFKLESKKMCVCCGAVEYTEIDSCCGFYGDDFVDSMLEYVDNEYVEKVAGLFKDI